MANGDRLEALDLPPALEARYRPVRVLGKGAFGVVFRAHQLDLARMVVVKLVRLEEAPDPVARERFLREAKVLASISTPYVSPVLDFGIDSTHAHLVFPDEGGTSLAVRLRERGERGKGLPGELCERLLRQALEGLAEVHAKGIVHRDLKPDNLLLTDRGDLRIIDFGLATPESSRSLTQTGAIVGTPIYMPPDQVAGHLPEPRDDLYSLAVTFYELWSGENPFRSESLDRVLEKQLYFDPPPLAEKVPGIPPAIAATLTEMLAKARAARPEGAREALARLDRAAPGPGADAGARTMSALTPAPAPGRSSLRVPLAATPPPVPPPRPWGRLVGAAALALALGYALPAFLVPRGGGPPDPEPSGPAAPPGGSGPGPPGLAEALQDTLEGLGPDPDPPRPSPDPVSWRAKVLAHPPVRIFLAWVDRGGHPEELPGAVRAGLARLGARLVARGLEDPFAPFFPDPVPGPGEWAAREAAAFAEGEALLAPLDQAVIAMIDGDEPPGVPAEVRRLFALVTPFVNKKSQRDPLWALGWRIMWGGDEARTLLDRWLAREGRAFERWLYLLGRAARSPGEDGERVAVGFEARLGRMRGLGLTAVLRHHPLTLLGGPPDSPAGSLVLAEYARAVRQSAVKIPEADATGLDRVLAEAHRGALEPPGDGPGARRRFRIAFERLGGNFLDALRREGVAAAVARAGPGLASLPTAEVEAMVARVRRDLLDEGIAHPGVVEAFDAALAALPLPRPSGPPPR